MKKIINKVQSVFKSKIIDVNIEFSQDLFVFKSLTEEEKIKIYESLTLLNEVDLLEAEDLSIKQAIIFSDKQSLAQKIFDEIIADYILNEEESKKDDFLFRYLLTETDIEPNAFRVTVELSDPDQKRGNVYYSLTVKKQNGKYYLWPFEY
jgi:hypothetical protein